MGTITKALATAAAEVAFGDRGRRSGDPRGGGDRGNGRPWRPAEAQLFRGYDGSKPGGQNGVKTYNFYPGKP